MKTLDDLPQDLTPLNLSAWLSNGLGLCGCSEVEPVRQTLIKALEWLDSLHEGRCPYTDIFHDDGVFYLIFGFLSLHDCEEHGGSIRSSWITSRGKRLLAALKQTTGEEIEGAQGEAYDGLYYPGAGLEE